MKDHLLWVEKYRPKRVEDCILPSSIKKLFQEYVKKQEIPNLLLSGNCGVGKTTIAKALCEDIGCEYLFINGSDENGIDTLRYKIKNYASSVSLSGGRKAIIIDEADYMNCLYEEEEIRVGTIDNWVPKKLKDLTDTFPVISFNVETGEFENDTATVISKSVAKTFLVTLVGGKSVVLTEDHPFIVQKGVRFALTTIKLGFKHKKILIHDSATDSFDFFKVSSIVPYGERNVIDITVDKNRTFVTGYGIVVHNCNSLQPALRGAIEEFSANCAFIFTCNYKNKIIDPIHSRCSVIDFDISKTEKSKLMNQFAKRVFSILDQEKVDYDKNVVAQFMVKYYPDNRKIINELQRYAQIGNIDIGILSQSKDVVIEELMGHLKNKKFLSIKKWLSENSDLDSQKFFRTIYDNSSEYIKPSSIPQLILQIDEYQYKAAFVADHQINMLAFLTKMMMDIEFI